MIFSIIAILLLHFIYFRLKIFEDKSIVEVVDKALPDGEDALLTNDAQEESVSSEEELTYFRWIQSFQHLQSVPSHYQV